MPGAGLFGAVPSAGDSSVGLFGEVIQAQTDSKRYTPKDQLTSEELAEFMADKFTLGKIPERPPPKELCA